VSKLEINGVINRPDGTPSKIFNLALYDPNESKLRSCIEVAVSEDGKNYLFVDTVYGYRASLPRTPSLDEMVIGWNERMCEIQTEISDFLSRIYEAAQKGEHNGLEDPSKN